MPIKSISALDLNMPDLSWLVRSEYATGWYWARNLDGFVVAAAVMAESVALWPSFTIPQSMRSPVHLRKIEVWGWRVLVVALLIEVPIEMARDAISSSAIGDLQDYVRPRTISDVQAAAIIAAEKPFAGTKFTIYAIVDSEPQRLMHRLDAVLIEAGWMHPGFPPSGGSDDGVVIRSLVYKSPPLDAAVNSLTEALRGTGIFAIKADALQSNFPLNSANTTAPYVGAIVTITIGSRPPLHDAQ